MAKQSKTLTFAVLGAALVSLALKAKGTAAETDLQDFIEDFAEFQKQQAAIPAGKDLSGDLKIAEGVIVDLKQQLKEAQEANAAIQTDKVIVTIDKVKYVVNHGSHPFSKEELAENLTELKRLLKIKGQNAITKLV